MAMSTTSTADKVTASVVVAQDGSGDYNGSTEVPIQKALDSLDGVGGWVFIKPGTYLIDNEINLISNVFISGVPHSTILKFKDGTNDTAIFRGSTDTQIKIATIKLDGNRDNVLSPGRGVYITGDRHIILEDLFCINFENDAIYLGGNYGRNFISNCFFEDCKSCIYTEMHHLTIKGNHMLFDDTGAVGIEMKYGSDALIESNHIDGQLSANDIGIYITGSTAKCRILNNNFRRLASGILEIDTANNNFYEGNYFAYAVDNTLVTAGNKTYIGINPGAEL